MLGKEQIAEVAEFLVHFGVQWPWESRNITDRKMLKGIWEYLLEKYVGGEENGQGAKDTVSGRSGDGTDAG